MERLLAPWLGPVQRVLAALAVVICPSLAIALFFVSREGLLMVILAAALVVALSAGVLAGRSSSAACWRSCRWPRRRASR